MTTSFNTLKTSSEAIYKEKGSKFIAIAQPATSIEDFELKLQNIKKDYHDARHHCYAYIIGDDGQLFRANDDGEPGHSAGDPILGQLKSFELTNIMVVVVRYFGGTKLGVSGLINAYKTSTREAIISGKIIKVNITKPIRIEYPYQSTNEVMKLLDQFNIKISDQIFESSCQVEGTISPTLIKKIKEKIELLNNLGVEIRLFI